MEVDDLSASGKLTVTVVKASNLTDEDWMPGELDPYVIVKLSDKACESCRTATVEISNLQHDRIVKICSLRISTWSTQYCLTVWKETL